MSNMFDSGSRCSRATLFDRAHVFIHRCAKLYLTLITAWICTSYGAIMWQARNKFLLLVKDNKWLKNDNWPTIAVFAHWFYAIWVERPSNTFLGIIKILCHSAIYLSPSTNETQCHFGVYSGCREGSSIHPPPFFFHLPLSRRRQGVWQMARRKSKARMAALKRHLSELSGKTEGTVERRQQLQLWQSLGGWETTPLIAPLFSTSVPQIIPATGDRSLILNWKTAKKKKGKKQYRTKEQQAEVFFLFLYGNAIVFLLGALLMLIRHERENIQMKTFRHRFSVTPDIKKTNAGTHTNDVLKFDELPRRSCRWKHRLSSFHPHSESVQVRRESRWSPVHPLPTSTSPVITGNVYAK